VFLKCIVFIPKYYSYNAETYSLDIEVHPEKSIMLDGDYETSGKVLILPIVGKGKCKIVIGNIIIKFNN